MKIQDFYSHQSLFDGEKLYFIYMDNPKNISRLRLKDVKAVKNYRQFAKTIVKSVSLSGEIATETWKELNDAPVLFTFMRWSRLSDKLYYFLPLSNGYCTTDRKKCFYFGKIALK